jgi:hypothetical protein
MISPNQQPSRNRQRQRSQHNDDSVYQDALDHIRLNICQGLSGDKTNGYPPRIMVAPSTWASRLASRCAA